MQVGDMHWMSELLTLAGFVLLTATALVSLVLVVLLEEGEYKKQWAPQFVYTYYFTLLRNPQEYLTDQGVKLLRLHKNCFFWGMTGTVVLFGLGAAETVYRGI